MATKFLKEMSDEELFGILCRDLWLEKFLRYADLHHVGHQKLVMVTLQTPGRYAFLPRIKGDGDAKLTTLERFEKLYKDHPDGPPETIRVKL